jgi:hypothetical protein
MDCGRTQSASMPGSRFLLPIWRCEPSRRVGWPQIRFISAFRTSLACHRRIVSTAVVMRPVDDFERPRRHLPQHREGPAGASFAGAPNWSTGSPRSAKWRAGCHLSTRSVRRGAA